MSGPAPAGAAGNLQVRIVSAVLLGAIALALTLYGGLPFRALAALDGEQAPNGHRGGAGA